MFCRMSTKTRQTRNGKYVCEGMSHLFGVRVVTMTFLFVNPKFIDIICTDRNANPGGSIANLQSEVWRCDCT